MPRRRAAADPLRSRTSTRRARRSRCCWRSAPCTNACSRLGCARGSTWSSRRRRLGRAPPRRADRLRRRRGLPVAGACAVDRALGERRSATSTRTPRPPSTTTSRRPSRACSRSCPRWASRPSSSYAAARSSRPRARRTRSSSAASAGTPSRIGGLGFERARARPVLDRHAAAFEAVDAAQAARLRPGALPSRRRAPRLEPAVVRALHKAIDATAATHGTTTAPYRAGAEQPGRRCATCSRSCPAGEPVPLDEVEPVGRDRHALRLHRDVARRAQRPRPTRRWPSA